MSKENDPRRSQYGLRGWKAFLVVLGSGTIAAFLIVALIVGILRSFVAGMSSTDTTEESGGTPLVKDTFKPGGLDICGAVYNEFLRSGSASRLDDKSGPLDTGTKSPNSNTRTLSDNCKWRLKPDGIDATWELTISYNAMIYTSKGVSKEGWARKSFEKQKRDSKNGFSKIKDEGPAGYVDYESSYIYGESNSKNKAPRYVLTGVAKSGVSQIVLEEIDRPGDVNDSIRQADFRENLNDITPRVFGRFVHRLPD